MTGMPKQADSKGKYIVIYSDKTSVSLIIKLVICGGGDQVWHTVTALSWHHRMIKQKLYWLKFVSTSFETSSHDI